MDSLTCSIQYSTKFVWYSGVQYNVPGTPYSVSIAVIDGEWRCQLYSYIPDEYSASFQTGDRGRDFPAAYKLTDFCHTCSHTTHQPTQSITSPSLDN